MKIQEIESFRKRFGCSLFIKRDDLIHEHVSGNKWWKLKYNIIEAQKGSYDTILTFGGAYSNHIAATAVAGRLAGIKTIGIIRGENNSNITLDFAREQGMTLNFIDRDAYRNKNEKGFLDSLKEKFGKFYLIPEGGANMNGVKGCTEILYGLDINYNYLCCACGTGTTLAGMMLSKKNDAKALGFSALKGGEFLTYEVEKFLNEYIQQNPDAAFDNNMEIITRYHFGGYAKIKPELIDFMQEFQLDTGIPLDYVYTGKMFYGIYDMASKELFKPNDQILAIHTGGLQGNAGMESKFLLF